MRKLITYLICGLFLLVSSGSVMAVEKKGKEKPKTTEPVKKKTKKPQATKAKPKKFDNFIDKNKNGIDDRQEKLVKKTNSKKVEKKTDSTKSKK